MKGEGKGRVGKYVTPHSTKRGGMDHGWDQRFSVAGQPGLDAAWFLLCGTVCSAPLVLACVGAVLCCAVRCGAAKV